MRTTSSLLPFHDAKPAEASPTHLDRFVPAAIALAGVSALLIMLLGRW